MCTEMSRQHMLTVNQIKKKSLQRLIRSEPDRLLANYKSERLGEPSSVLEKLKKCSVLFSKLNKMRVFVVR